MDTRSGELHKNISSAEAQARGLAPITEKEHKEAEAIPPEKRPMELGCSRYVNSLKNINFLTSIKLRQAFRAGYEQCKEDNA